MTYNDIKPFIVARGNDITLDSCNFETLEAFEEAVKICDQVFTAHHCQWQMFHPYQNKLKAERVGHWLRCDTDKGPRTIEAWRDWVLQNDNPDNQPGDLSRYHPG